MPFRRQAPGRPIFIGNWPEDDDYAIYPKGSQPKRTVICPPEPPDPCLIAGHRYIFKTAKRPWQNQHLWSEILAYGLGRLVGLDMPPCFLGVDERTGQTGVLMEFFYGYSGENGGRLVHGMDVLGRTLRDRKKGRPHTLSTNIRICRALGLDACEAWWARVLAFDMIIGNSDRHPDNWGFLWHREEGARSILSFAPVFDNATSLGYEQTEAKLPALMVPESLRAYVKRGTHHCGWDRHSDEPTPPLDLCRRFLEAFPQTHRVMAEVAGVDRKAVATLCQTCCQFAVSVPFSPQRAAFVTALVALRCDMLLTELGAVDGKLD